ncbi:Rpn family recombination-promoting nuclease/putative transposase [Treponema pedis]|uniref:Rpn family recombination-promoting nuclease/putative transposase n=1 Tax=Treponema pedis TaxID=409322 RepID=A0A7S7AVT9_9SPIR|nr:Rpn family recombination-promoting nuclease/putative transposase [Treponema pedis]QOW60560.1 Rpn family recombination-promoting nuclease/putative transposase [Treponema pedis]
MSKSFDELTIVDDYMFYRVMEDTDICKTLLNIVLRGKAETITEIELQKTLADAGRAKGVRFDVWAKTLSGTIYDVEMQAINKNDLARRIRYYQSAIDVSVLERNRPYENLPDSFILFFCTFDYMGKGLPVYTFKSTCAENKNLLLPDGITKIIINSKAAEKEANAELKAFLHYMNGKESNDGFIRKIEQRVREIKENETLRREYMLINSFERDARNDGWKAGMQAGMEAGIARGFSDGVRETAAALKTMGLSIEQIMQATNLSKTEIEKL